MNDPEVTMPDVLATSDLIAHRKALEAAGTAIGLVLRVPAPLKPIADLLIRSASSVPANLAEGQGKVRPRSRPVLANRVRLGQGGRQPFVASRGRVCH